jgi:TolB-like protein/class 3 adenylate cyclase/Tfp pilus assembly protein PilF
MAMAEEQKTTLRLEIAHVLFIDIVGYSKLLLNQQSELLRELNEVVSATNEFRNAESEAKLIRLPTGDGMALVFRTNPDAPAQCAMEISRALKGRPHIQLRMGVHSGPVHEITDVNRRENIAGAGINMAQRVMDCGDAGHILLSRHVAEDLEEHEKWRPLLHDLGACEVKHGLRIGIMNLYDSEVGNPQLPSKVRAVKKHRARVRWAEVTVALLVLAAIVTASVWLLRRPARQALSVAEKSIAVLPFQNLSKEEENAFFADGVQDEILTNLARIAELKVISRTSVMQYKSGIARNLREIGKQLGVAHLVEGSVQRGTGKVRVNAQLIDARTDRHLWGHTYDRDLADVFAIQSEIAKTIAAQLQAKLSPDEKNAIERRPTSDITAFDLYTQAKNFLLAVTFGGTVSANLMQAVDLLNQAVARDPSFFQAYCELAYAHDALYFFGSDHTSARLALAEAAIQVASRLRPDAGEVHLARAQNLYWGYLDYNGALVELEAAGKTLPNDARLFELTGYVERRRPGGNVEEALRTLQHAINLDPGNVRTLQQTALSYRALRRYAEEKSLLDRVLVLVPKDLDAKVARAFAELDSKADTQPLHQIIDSIRATNRAATQSIADSWLVCALAERDAIAAKDALMALGKNEIALSSADNFNFTRSFMEGIIARMTQDDENARSAFSAARAEQEEIVGTQPNYGPALCVLGLIDAGLGRKEEALREGRRAVELLPVEKDAYQGAAMVKYLAMIAAWVGDKDLACEQLASVVRRRSHLSYGELKLLPWWDPLRGDPRFEKLVEEAKKPIVLK